jgi:hypothetical protein
MTIEEIPQLVSSLGFPIAVSCYLLWERVHIANANREERKATLQGLKQVIKVDLVNAINDLKMEIVKLNERCNGGKKR